MAPIRTYGCRSGKQNMNAHGMAPTCGGRMSAVLPNTILSEALLESVGTFGVFWKTSNQEYELFYSTASNLSPV
jgi:hypothetical protein